MNYLKFKNFFIKKWIFDVLIILLLGLLSVTWFRGNNLISGGDFGMPLDWVKYLSRMFSSWEDTYSLGASEFRQATMLVPYALSGGILQSLGFSLVLIEKIFFYVWFAGGGLSMYYLTCVLGMKRLGRIAGSILYMLNPFSLIVIWRVSHGLIQMPYAFAPLVLAFYINGIQRNKGFIYQFLTCIFWGLITTSAYGNPRAIVVHWLLISFYFVIAFIFNKPKRNFILKYTVKLLLIWSLLNLYWILPFIISASESVSSAHMSVLLIDIETLKLNSVRLLDAIRMLGLWSLHSGYKGDPYYQYEAYYSKSIINLIISWLIPIFVIIGFFNKETRKNHNILFFLCIIGFGLIGMSGVYSPLAGVLIGIYNTFPTLTLLARFAFLLFGIPTYLIFCVLFGYGVLNFYEWGKRLVIIFIYPLMIVLFTLIFIVLVWPFWSSDVIRNEGKLMPGEIVQTPSYWWDTKEWLSTQTDFFRILPLPMSKTYNVAFTWKKGYTGGDPTRWFTNQPVINTNTGWTFGIPELIGDSIVLERTIPDLGKLLGLMNVKYTLIREDTNWDFIRGHNWWFNQYPDNINKFLSTQKDLSLKKEIGKLKFYKVDQKYNMPHIYTLKYNSYLVGSLEGFMDILPFINPKEEGIVFADQNAKVNLSEIKYKHNYIWQEPSIPNEGLKNLNFEEISANLPYVRILPDSYLYSLIKAKEILIKLLASPENKWQKEHIFFEKRLKETYLLAKKGKISTAVNSINQANNHWKLINAEIAKEKDKDKKNKLYENLKTSLPLYRIFIKNFRENFLANTEDKTLVEAVTNLETILQIRKGNLVKNLETSYMGKNNFNTNKVEYSIKIADKGKYMIYLRNDQFLKYYQPGNNQLTYKIDDQPIQKKQLNIVSDNIINIGEVELNEGNHKIALDVPKAINMIQDPSFELGLWSNAFETEPSLLKPIIKARHSTDAIDGNTSLQLSTNQNTAAVSGAIENFLPGQIYKITFAVKHVSGAGPKFEIWENDSKNNVPIINTYMGPFGSPDPLTKLAFIQPLSQISRWNIYQFIFKPLPTTRAAGILFLSETSENENTVNLFDDVRVERIFTNPILLKKINTQFSIFKKPIINFSKITPTKYNVEVKEASGPFVLVFSESFHEGWKLSIPAAHFIANGFANGWYINKKGDYMISIDFAPQKIYLISSIITIFSVIIILAFILYRKYILKKIKT